MAETGFHWVYYRHECTYRPFRARIFSGGPSLGYFRTARDAAEAVGYWMTDRYGPDWTRETLRARKTPLRFIIRDPAGDDGFIVIAFIMGQRKMIQPKGRADTFKTKAEAKRYFKIWLKERYGPQGHKALRR